MHASQWLICFLEHLGTLHSHGRDLEGAPGSWIQISSALAVATIWEMNQWMQSLSVSKFLKIKKEKNAKETE